MSIIELMTAVQALLYEQRDPWAVLSLGCEAPLVRPPPLRLDEAEQGLMGELESMMASAEAAAEPSQPYSREEEAVMVAALRKSYLKLSSRIHPEKVKGEGERMAEAAEAFQALVEAYEQCVSEATRPETPEEKAEREAREAAAVRMQGMARGRKARAQVAARREEEKRAQSALLMQRHARARAARAELNARRAAKAAREEAERPARERAMRLQEKERRMRERAINDVRRERERGVTYF